MAARDDYPKLHHEHSGQRHQGLTSREALAALDEIDRLRIRVEAAEQDADRLAASIHQHHELTIDRARQLMFQHADAVEVRCDG